MKVGILVKDQTPETGGGYTFQSEILEAFFRLWSESSHRFSLIVPTPRMREALSERAERHGLALVVPPQASPRQAVTLSSRIARRLRRHLPRIGAPAPNPIERAARAAGIEFLWCVSHCEHAFDIPYLTVVWDLEHRAKPWFPEVSASGEWDRREAWFGSELRRATYIVTGTRAGRDEIRSFYQVPEQRILLLPHPTPRFSETGPPVPVESVRAKYDLKRDYLIYPAQFWAHKNHVNLVLALTELAKRQEEFDLVLLGSDQGNRAHVERIARESGVADRVRILGFVSVAELVALYRGAFALTYASLFGPENLPPLEAFALGCPVIAARVDGTDEQLGDAALLVDGRKPAEIADAVRRLRSDGELRAELVRKGALRARAWTADDFVRGVFSALDAFGAVRRNWPS